jgi:hypothetical protein
MSCKQSNVSKALTDLSQLNTFTADQPIRIQEFDTASGKRYHFSYVPYQPPVISLTPSVTAAEVGRTIGSVSFKGSILKGSNPLVSKSIDPASIPDYELDSNFVFTVENVFRGTAGQAGVHTITVNDGEQDSVFSQGVDFVWRHYTGLSTDAAITGIDGFQSQLAPYAEQDYNIGENGSYIYWLRQQDENPITRVSKGGFDFGITELSPISINNQYAISTTYRVWRTSNKLNTGTIEKLQIS